MAHIRMKNAVCEQSVPLRRHTQYIVCDIKLMLPISQSEHSLCYIDHDINEYYNRSHPRNVYFFITFYIAPYRNSVSCRNLLYPVPVESRLLGYGFYRFKNKAVLHYIRCKPAFDAVKILRRIGRHHQFRTISIYIPVLTSCHRAVSYYIVVIPAYYIEDMYILISAVVQFFCQIFIEALYLLKTAYAHSLIKQAYNVYRKIFLLHKRKISGISRDHINMVSD